MESNVFVELERIQIMIIFERYFWVYYYLQR